MQIGATLLAATQKLTASSPTPRLDAELLLAHVLGWSRAKLVAERTWLLEPAQAAAFWQLVERRGELEPVAYLIGQREFFGMPLQVDRRVLVPRPETELLVELALQWLARQSGQPVVADIGTGSGAIALAIAKHAPQARVIATDLSAAALAVAMANAERLGLAPRITFCQGDLGAALPEPVDLLLSNPPYTLLAEIDEGVRRHEPHLALDGGPDGLAYYRRLANEAPAWLKPGGALLVEIGAWQAEAVSALFAAAWPRHAITVHRDLAARERVVAVQQ